MGRDAQIGKEGRKAVSEFVMKRHIRSANRCSGAEIQMEGRIDITKLGK